MPPKLKHEVLDKFRSFITNDLNSDINKLRNFVVACSLQNKDKNPAVLKARLEKIDLGQLKILPVQTQAIFDIFKGLCKVPGNEAFARAFLAKIKADFEMQAVWEGFKNNNLMTLFQHAIAANSIPYVDIFFEAGADVNIYHKSINAIQMALLTEREGKSEVLNYFLSNHERFNINFMPENPVHSPLLFAYLNTPSAETVERLEAFCSQQYLEERATIGTPSHPFITNSEHGLHNRTCNAVKDQRFRSKHDGSLEDVRGPLMPSQWSVNESPKDLQKYNNAQYNFFKTIFSEDVNVEQLDRVKNEFRKLFDKKKPTEGELCSRGVEDPKLILEMLSLEELGMLQELYFIYNMKADHDEDLFQFITSKAQEMNEYTIFMLSHSSRYTRNDQSFEVARDTMSLAVSVVEKHKSAITNKKKLAEFYHYVGHSKARVDIRDPEATDYTLKSLKLDGNNIEILCKHYFAYMCNGDIDNVRTVINLLLGPDCKISNAAEYAYLFVNYSSVLNDNSILQEYRAPPWYRKAGDSLSSIRSFDDSRVDKIKLGLSTSIEIVYARDLAKLKTIVEFSREFFARYPEEIVPHVAHFTILLKINGGEKILLDFYKEMQSKHPEHFQANIDFLYAEFLLYRANNDFENAIQVGKRFNELSKATASDRAAPSVFVDNVNKFLSYHFIEVQDYQKALEYSELVQDPSFAQQKKMARIFVEQEQQKQVAAQEVKLTPAVEEVKRGVEAAVEDTKAKTFSLPDNLDEFALKIDNEDINIVSLPPQLMHLYFQYKNANLHQRATNVMQIPTTHKWHVGDKDYAYTENRPGNVKKLKSTENCHIAIDEKLLAKLDADQKVAFENSFAREDIKIYRGIAELRMNGDERLSTTVMYKNKSDGSCLMVFNKLSNHKSLKGGLGQKDNSLKIEYLDDENHDVQGLPVAALKSHNYVDLDELFSEYAHFVGEHPTIEVSGEDSDLDG